MVRSLVTRSALFLAVSLMAGPNAQGEPGELDPTFGDGGKHTVEPAPAVPSTDAAASVPGGPAPTATAAPAPGRRPWPIELPPESESTLADLNADGVSDERVEVMDGGSGWKTFVTCVRDGGTDAIACEEVSVTAYAMFEGLHRVLDPPTGNAAAALLPQTECASLDAKDPAQGSLFALRAEAPFFGEWQPSLRWLAGRPVDQASVCMSGSDALTFPGGDSWRTASDEAVAIPTGWTVYYAAAWPQWTVAGEEHGRTPRVVARVGALDVYQHGHALAVYDAARNRHAWIANWGRPSGGFKVDRWERIASVHASDPTHLEVQVADADATDPLRIDLSAASLP